VKRFAVETTGPAVALRLTPDRASMLGDGLDAQPVTVEAIDAAGRAVPVAQHTLRFAVDGGDIIGLGNGNPNDTSSEKGATRALFNGMAQAIVRTREGTSAPLRLRVSAPGLREASLAIPVHAARPWPTQATSGPVQIIGGWRAAPVSDTPPDPALRVGDNDMNSWTGVTPGSAAKPAGRTGYVLYAADVQPFARVQKDGGRLELLEVTGPCQVFVDGRLAGAKTSAAPGALRLAFPAGLARCRISIVCRVEAGQAHGLSGPVRIRA
jgi:beta-galactosidase